MAIDRIEICCVTVVFFRNANKTHLRCVLLQSIGVQY